MKKVFLFGGCVIRDAYQMLRPEIGLAGYVARQSLLSAMGPSTDLLEEPVLESKFQERMLRGDIAGDLLEQIDSVSEEIDLLVIDCNIERVGVYELEDGSYITRSSELAKSGIMSNLSQQPRVVSPWTQGFQEKYRFAASGLVEELAARDLLGRTMLVRSPMALLDSNGDPFDKHVNRPVDQVRDALLRVTDVLASQGIDTISLPEDLAIGDPGHQWGRMPLHYIPTATKWVASEMRSRAVAGDR